MRTCTLTRTETGNDGTFGHLVTDEGLFLRSGELPWRNNEPGRSCIPIGKYEVYYALSPTKGWCYHVTKVPDRLDIEIHPANFCGDRILGMKCQLEGCICLGTSVGPMNGQKAILCSHQAFTELYGDLRREPFELTILNSY
jgi:Family of unknown function (DUF5675)